MITSLHIDTADGDIPVACLLTSASLHDSQVAIPLATLTASRVTNLYDLMDSAYDAPEIWDKSRALGHAPIIDAIYGGKANVSMSARIVYETGEVGVTDWKTSFPDTDMPAHVRVKRCLQKLEKV